MKFIMCLVMVTFSYMSICSAKVCVTVVNEKAIFINGQKHSAPPTIGLLNYTLKVTTEGLSQGSLNLKVVDGKFDLKEIAVSGVDSKLEKRSDVLPTSNNLDVDNQIYISMYAGKEFCSNN